MKSVRTVKLLLAAAMMLACVVSLQAAQPVFVRALDYQAQTMEPNDTGIFSLAVGDLNRDGKKDIFVGLDTFGILPACYTPWIATGPTDPRGTLFTERMYDNGGVNPFTVYVGDWTGDGNNDAIVTRGFYDPCEPDPAYNRLGQFCSYRSLTSAWGWSGGWEYDPSPYFTTVGGPFKMPQPIDLDGNGYPDLVTVRNQDGKTCLRLNDGLGHFPNTDTYSVDQIIFNENAPFSECNEPYAVATGHLDATSPAGQNDIAIVRPSDGALFILFQHKVGNKYFNADANYVSRPTIYAGYGSHDDDLHLRVTHLAIGDFDADGKNDIAVVRENGDLFINFQRPAKPGTVVPDFSNNPQVMTYGRKLVDMKVADVDGDGRTDIVAARSDGVLSILYQKSPGVFSYKMIDRWPADYNDANGLITSVAIGDMDGPVDGIKDITVGLTNGRIFTYYGLCSQGIEGDLTGDCMVDFRDVKQFASQWLQTPPVIPGNTPGIPTAHTEDLSGDGTINFKDMAILALDWMKCNLVDKSNCWK